MEALYSDTQYWTYPYQAAVQPTGAPSRCVAGRGKCGLRQQAPPAQPSNPAMIDAYPVAATH